MGIALIIMMGVVLSIGIVVIPICVAWFKEEELKYLKKKSKYDYKMCNIQFREKE